MMYRSLFAWLATAFMVGDAAAHSWVRCTDYQVDNPQQDPRIGRDEPDELRRVYNDSACFGYSPRFAAADGGQGLPRDFPFGQDRGFNHQPGNNGPYCNQEGQGNVYDDTHPLAVYQPGQVVTVAYPAKNHVAANCNRPGDVNNNNVFIPDFDIGVYYAASSIDSDFPDRNTFVQNEAENLNLMHVNGVEDYLGFQRCPEFCDPTGTDRVLCTQSFVVPADLAPGIYDFVQEWAFNGPTDVYTTCWKASVGGQVATTTTARTTTTQATTTTEATTDDQGQTNPTTEETTEQTTTTQVQQTQNPDEEDPETPDDFRQLDCYNDNNGGEQERILGMLREFPTDLTHENCFAHCLSAGDQFDVFGVSAGSECWCGYMEARADDPLPFNLNFRRQGTSNECFTNPQPCTGNANQNCGGPTLDMLVFEMFLSSADGVDGDGCDENGQKCDEDGAAAGNSAAQASAGVAAAVTLLTTSVFIGSEL